MKGLLYKDRVLVFRQCRLQLGAIALITIVSPLGATGLIFLIYPILFAGMIPAYLLSLDEKDGWTGYLRFLPVSPRLMVTEKYIVSLVSIAAVTAFMAAVWLIFLLVSGLPLAKLGTIIPLAFAVGLLYPAIMLPPMFRAGVEKGRFIAAAGIALAVLAVFLLADDMEKLLEPAASAGLLALPAISLALFALSWFISTKIVK